MCMQNILQDTQFVEAHLTKAPNIDDGLVIQDRENISDILLVYNYKLELEKADTSHPNCDSRPCQKFSIPTTAAQFYNYIVSLIGSCNGLLCLQYRTRENLNSFYYVCNPILGEFLALPLDDNPRYSTQPSAFGFCPKNKQYKVIRFFTSSLCKIHTLGTNCWRTISNAPFPCTAVSFDYSLRGILHWIIKEFTVSKLICSFNLETEEISLIPTPFHLNHDTLRRLTFIQTGSLGGLFCFGYVLDNTHYEVCVMKEYGVKESWTKDFTIDLRLISGLQERTIYLVLELMDNGDFLFKSKMSSIVCYNIWKETITDLLGNNVANVQVMAFFPSFISLKDIAVASGGNVEVVQRKMGRNLWSDKGFQFIC